MDGYGWMWMDMDGYGWIEYAWIWFGPIGPRHPFLQVLLALGFFVPHEGELVIAWQGGRMRPLHAYVRGGSGFSSNKHGLMLAKVLWKLKRQQQGLALVTKGVAFLLARQCELLVWWWHLLRQSIWQHTVCHLEFKDMCTDMFTIQLIMVATPEISWNIYLFRGQRLENCEG